MSLGAAAQWATHRAVPPLARGDSCAARDYAAHKASTSSTPPALIESLLIVLSVLLGFAATEWHDRHAERALAAEALQNFRREIRQNLAALDTIYPKHVALVARLSIEAQSRLPGETAFHALVRALPARRPGAMPEGIECVQLYSRARTAYDSARIEARLPFVASGKQPYAPTCGTLRRSGQLQRP